MRVDEELVLRDDNEDTKGLGLSMSRIIIIFNDDQTHRSDILDGRGQRCG